jgi:hypothetical protein
MYTKNMALGTLAALLLCAAAAAAADSIVPEPPSQQAGDDDEDSCNRLPGYFVGPSVLLTCAGGYVMDYVGSNDPGLAWCKGCISRSCIDGPPEDFCECVHAEWFPPDSGTICPSSFQLWHFTFQYGGQCDVCLPGDPVSVEGSTWGRTKATYRRVERKGISP